MQLRTRRMRYWLGNLMVVAMLFSHSAILWAKLETPVKPQETMQHDCHSKHKQDTRTQHHCKKDCCKDGKMCSTACLHCVVVGTASMLPVSVTALHPHFRITSLVSTLSVAPSGTDATVIYRPPQTTF